MNDIRQLAHQKERRTDVYLLLRRTHLGHGLLQIIQKLVRAKCLCILLILEDKKFVGEKLRFARR